VAVRLLAFRIFACGFPSVELKYFLNAFSSNYFLIGFIFVVFDITVPVIGVTVVHKLLFVYFAVY
jgi:NADH:ubiquinone oxidoreductase subunit 3 (subunit A)